MGGMTRGGHGEGSGEVWRVLVAWGGWTRRWKQVVLFLKMGWVFEFGSGDGRVAVRSWWT